MTDQSVFMLKLGMMADCRIPYGSPIWDIALNFGHRHNEAVVVDVKEMAAEIDFAAGETMHDQTDYDLLAFDQFYHMTVEANRAGVTLLRLLPLVEADHA